MRFAMRAMAWKGRLRSSKRPLLFVSAVGAIRPEVKILDKSGSETVSLAARVSIARWNLKKVAGERGED
jgi:hypothetical protein